jgi:hypothetical protein
MFTHMGRKPTTFRLPTGYSTNAALLPCELIIIFETSFQNLHFGLLAVAGVLAIDGYLAVVG